MGLCLWPRNKTVEAPACSCASSARQVKWDFRHIFVFLDIEGILHIDFVPECQPVNQQVYIGVPKMDYEGCKEKIPSKQQYTILISVSWQDIIQLQHCAFSCYAITTWRYLALCAAILALCDFFLFPKMTAQLEGWRLEDVMEIENKCCTLLDVIVKQGPRNGSSSARETGLCV